MPTDQPGNLIAEEAPPTASPIENELPTYRAISNRAVVSLICGALASFSFADLNFLFFAALAVVVGILANRAIRRAPDTLTGSRLANAGIALGLIFGLTVVTYSTIQYIIIKREASRFGLEYARVLKEGTFGDALLLGDPPERRQDRTGADKQKEWEQMKAKDRMMLETKMGSVTNLRKALSTKDAHIHLLSIENQGVDESISAGIYYFATILYEVEGATPPPGTPPTSGPLYALAVIKGHARGRHYEWWVEDTRFPYTPKSYQAKSKPVDDGHGHAH